MIPFNFTYKDTLLSTDDLPISASIGDTFLIEDTLYYRFSDSKESNIDNYCTFPKFLTNANYALGEQGETGEDGDKGFLGTTGEQGLQGERGKSGREGEQGIQGVQGDQGIRGIRGPKGFKGSRGKKGVQGVQGIKGQKGIKGERGEQGIRGDDGAIKQIKFSTIIPKEFSDSPSVSFKEINQTDSETLYQMSISLPNAEAEETYIIDSQVSFDNWINKRLEKVPTKVFLQSGEYNVSSYSQYNFEDYQTTEIIGSLDDKTTIRIPSSAQFLNYKGKISNIEFVFVYSRIISTFRNSLFINCSNFSNCSFVCCTGFSSSRNLEIFYNCENISDVLISCKHVEDYESSGEEASFTCFNRCKNIKNVRVNVFNGGDSNFPIFKDSSNVCDCQVCLEDLKLKPFVTCTGVKDCVIYKTASNNLQDFTDLEKYKGCREVTVDSSFFSNKEEIFDYEYPEHTFLIDSEDKFNQWINNESGNDYSKVLLTNDFFHKTIPPGDYEHISAKSRFFRERFIKLSRGNYTFKSLTSIATIIENGIRFNGETTFSKCTLRLFGRDDFSLYIPSGVYYNSFVSIDEKTTDESSLNGPFIFDKCYLSIWGNSLGGKINISDLRASNSDISIIRGDVVIGNSNIENSKILLKSPDTKVSSFESTTINNCKVRVNAGRGNAFGSNSQIFNSDIKFNFENESELESVGFYDIKVLKNSKIEYTESSKNLNFAMFQQCNSIESNDITCKYDTNGFQITKAISSRGKSCSLFNNTFHFIPQKETSKISKWDFPMFNSFGIYKGLYLKFGSLGTELGLENVQIFAPYATVENCVMEDLNIEEVAIAKSTESFKNLYISGQKASTVRFNDVTRIEGISLTHEGKPCESNRKYIIGVRDAMNAYMTHPGQSYFWFYPISYTAFAIHRNIKTSGSLAVSYIEASLADSIAENISLESGDVDVTNSCINNLSSSSQICTFGLAENSIVSVVNNGAISATQVILDCHASNFNIAKSDDTTALSIEVNCDTGSVWNALLPTGTDKLNEAILCKNLVLNDADNKSYSYGYGVIPNENIKEASTLAIGGFNSD